MFRRVSNGGFLRLPAEFGGQGEFGIRQRQMDTTYAEEAGLMGLPDKGGCICGAIRYEITQEPIRAYACRCTDCQRAMVSAFSAVPSEAFRLTGEELQPAPGGMTVGGVRQDALGAA
jgi:hypothetical protein